jgi:uncharacterized membrane protein YphA (DoxX/SURF4 family)
MTRDSDSTAPFSLGRVLLGLGLALQATEDFRDMDDTVGYAESAGVPMPELLAPVASVMMFVCGLGIAFWRLPRIMTGGAATFLTVVTTQMHDFWNKPEDQRDGERLAFWGNIAMLGGVLVLLHKAWD